MVSALQADNNAAMAYVLAGVAFTNMPDGGGMPDGKLSYKLRFSSEWRQVLEMYSDWYTNLDYPIEQTIGPRERRSDTGGEPCKIPSFVPWKSRIFQAEKGNPDVHPETSLALWPPLDSKNAKILGSKASLDFQAPVIYPVFILNVTIPFYVSCISWLFMNDQVHEEVRIQHVSLFCSFSYL